MLLNPNTNNINKTPNKPNINYRHKVITGISTIVLLAAINACASKPTRVEVAQDADNSLNCGQLGSEITQAEFYKKDARKEDKFMLKHMNPINGFISIYRINKAESNAQKRIDHLNSIAAQKNCTQAQLQAGAMQSQQGDLGQNPYQNAMPQQPMPQQMQQGQMPMMPQQGMDPQQGMNPMDGNMGNGMGAMPNNYPPMPNNAPQAPNYQYPAQPMPNYNYPK